MANKTGLQGQDARTGFSAETGDLRKHPIYKARAFHYPYRSPTATLGNVVDATSDHEREAHQASAGMVSIGAIAKRLSDYHRQAPKSARSIRSLSEPKQTAGLAVGTQARLIAAAQKAVEADYPINTFLTVHWGKLFSDGDLHPLRTMEPPERIRYLVELIRKWLTGRGFPAIYIWVREVSDRAGEHWHFGFHLPVNKRAALIGYLETILVEPQAPCPRPASKRTRGEFACSELTSWHLAGDKPEGRGYFTGYWIAAYLGKGEPSQRMFRGKLVNNTAKPVRGVEFGGRVKGGRYDVPQGIIKGTSARKGRFDVSRCLK